ncbi:hypothetical protein SPFM12_00006 [Salmonella phage SPFM12]|nr:hypothetical protein SPFM12_00006 [Salmonella phage SPFM12]
MMNYETGTEIINQFRHGTKPLKIYGEEWVTSE